ncbi:MAG: AEC family transporter [Clostridia bacterium]|nr:AEC family transporter [Clostridia bacterium]
MSVGFLDVLLAVLSLIVLVVPGYLLVKGKLINQSAGEVCSSIVLYGCQPALVFMGFQKAEYNSQIGLNMIIVALLGVLMHFIMFGVMQLCTIKASKTAKLNVIKYASIFSNCGFMGLPFLQLLFSGDTTALGNVMIYAAVIVAIFNILNWTLGVYTVSGDKKSISFRKIILNPTIIAVILGFICFMIFKKPLVDLLPEGKFADNLVEKLMQSVNFIGDMVTPLSMTVIGIRLAYINLTRLFTEKAVYVVAFFKLIVMSLLTTLVVAFLPIDVHIKYVLFFLFSMPCATSSAMFAIKFGSDGDTATLSVLFCTVSCILTIPLMFLLFSTIVVI